MTNEELSTVQDTNPLLFSLHIGTQTVSRSQTDTSPGADWLF